MDQDLIDIRNIRIHIPGLKKQYRFLHITDAHLVLYDDTETQRRADYAAPRHDPMFAKDGIFSEVRVNALWQYIQAHSDPTAPDALDGVLLTGDILDFPSGSNLAFLEARLDELKIPYVYVLGNHDWTYFDDYRTPHAMVANRPQFCKWSGGNTFVHKQRIGELTFVAVDNTMELYEDGVAETLEEVLQGEDNVLLLQHIPLYVPSLHEDTVAYWRSDINIGGEGICKNDNWKTVQKLVLADSSPIRALITGHLHFWHEDLIGGKIPQYITALAANGCATLFTIEG